MEVGVGIQDNVTAALQEIGVTAAPVRTFLIQRGYFIGYKFRFDGGYAVQLVGQKAVQIYDDEGKLLKTAPHALPGSETAA